MVVSECLDHELIEILAQLSRPGVDLAGYGDQEMLLVVADLYDVAPLLDGYQEISAKLGEIA